MASPKMNGFADIHTHILPGVDDGAASLRQACELVRMAFRSGTRTIFLTPHYRGSFKKNTPDMLREDFEDFCDVIYEQFPEIELFLGNEIYYETEAPERLAAGRILSLCDSDYALLEFRTGSFRSQVISGVEETLSNGFTPVIAHAERYEVFRNERDLADEVLGLGALIQLNADSVLGGHGAKVKKFCHELLREHKAHFIASDAHDEVHRPPLLRECYWHVHKKYGEQYAAELFYSNAMKIIDNRTI